MLGAPNTIHAINHAQYLAALGIILAAVYLLYLVQRVVYGPASPKMLPKLTDLNTREFGMLVPLVVLVFWIGLYPKPLLDVMHASVERVVATQSASVIVKKEESAHEQVVVMTNDTSHAMSYQEAKANP